MNRPSTLPGVMRSVLIQAYDLPLSQAIASLVPDKGTPATCASQVKVECNPCPCEVAGVILSSMGFHLGARAVTSSTADTRSTGALMRRVRSMRRLYGGFPVVMVSFLFTAPLKEAGVLKQTIFHTPSWEEHSVLRPREACGCMRQCPRRPLRTWSAFSVARRWHPPLPWQSRQILQSLRAWRHGVAPSRRQQPPSGRTDARCRPSQITTERTPAPEPCASERHGTPPIQRLDALDTRSMIRTTAYVLWGTM